MWAIETNRLSKRFGEVHSLVDCNLQVPQGIVFGLLGPNGAGKSTLLRSLLGFVRPTSGQGAVCGYNILHHSLQVRQQVAYLPGDARLYRSMRGSRILEMFAELHPCGSLLRSQAVAQRLDLDVSRRVAFMSTGMRQKLALAIVLGNRAPVVILDEPTANLDPAVTASVLDLVREARSHGQTVVLSSHIFSDIDSTCDEAAIMRSGSIVAQHRLDELASLHSVQALVSKHNGPAELPLSLREEATYPPFVKFCQLVTTTRNAPQPNGEPAAKLLLQLNGSGRDWLPWLADLQAHWPALCELKIERAGIRSIYDRHLSTPTNQALPPVQEPSN